MASTFNSFDPRTGAPGPDYTEAEPAAVEAAVAAAEAAFASPALRDRDARDALLRGAADRLRAAGDDIVAVCESESGLPETRLRGELERTCGQLEAFADLLAEGDYVDAIVDRPDPGAKPLPRPDVRRMLVPLGPVAVFGASNFPLAFSTAGGDTASALAAGCPVVVKGHPSHPGTGERVAAELRAAVAAAGMPDGTFAHLLAGGQELGERLVDAPGIAAVGFTGSFVAGRALTERAARRRIPIPVYAEMGSLNPVVVSEAALAARSGAIAEGLVTAVATSGGQLCTKPNLVFVPAGPAGDAFAADVAARLAAVDPPVLLNERLRDGLRDAVAALLARPEVEALTPVAPPAEPDPGFRHPAVACQAPADALGDAPELLEEHFGPVVLLLRWGTPDELLRALGRLDGQLAAAVHADPDADLRLLGLLTDVLAARAGRLVYDGWPTGVVVSHAMHHGGPYPATSAPAHTSVGMTAIRRWLRPVAYQNAPQAILPLELRDANSLQIWRRVDGELTRSALRAR